MDGGNHNNLEVLEKDAFLEHLSDFLQYLDKVCVNFSEHEGLKAMDARSKVVEENTENILYPSNDSGGGNPNSNSGVPPVNRSNTA